MWRKFLWLALLGLALVAVGAAPAPEKWEGMAASARPGALSSWKADAWLRFQTAPQGEKRVVWERMDVVLRVAQDGTLEVEERIRVHFEGGPFHFGFRSIDTRYTTGIGDIQVSDDLGPYHPGRSGEPRAFILEKTSQRVTVRWFFEPVSDVTRTFVVRYRVEGALRFYEGGEQLWWQAVFPERDGPVLASTVEVYAPGPIRHAEAYFVPARIERIDEQAVRFVAEKQIPSGVPFEVRVEWPAGVVAGTPAPWQAQADAEAAARERRARWEQTWKPVVNLAFLVLSATFLVLGIVGLYLLWYFKGRDPYAQVFAEYLTEPPSDLPPALVGAVVDERVDIKEIMATLFDLARRGYLVIREVAGFTGTDFQFRLTGRAVPLRDFEKVLMNRLFHGARERRLSDWKHLLGSTDGQTVIKAIWKAAKEAGLFPHNPDRVRALYRGVGMLMFIGGVFFGVVAGNTLSQWVTFVWCPGMVFAILGMALVVVGQFMPRKTRRGVEEAAKWRAFERYLRRLDKVDVARAQEILERYLPYAIALGVETAFLKRLEALQREHRRPVAELPSWYHPAGRGYVHSSGPRGKTASPGPSTSPGEVLSGASRSLGSGLSNLSQSLGTMLSTAALVMAPPSRSSSGGFSGGGSSGGGGGGGGGGGFG